jgi:hypothetical protein
VTTEDLQDNFVPDYGRFHLPFACRLRHPPGRTGVWRRGISHTTIRCW